MTRRTIGDNFAMPQHKVHVWHFFKLPFNSEKCFHHKKNKQIRIATLTTLAIQEF